MFINQFPDKKAFMALAQNANVIPLCIEMLADTDTPVSVLKKIHPEKSPVFLLESVEGGEHWGRYSFLSSSAHSYIRVFHNFVEIEENQIIRKIDHQGKPLKVLRTLMQTYQPAEVLQLPRFWGGMVGYFTYEMASFFENIHSPISVATNKPLAQFVIPDELLIFDNIKHTLTVVMIAFIQPGDDINTLYEHTLQQVQQAVSRLNNASVSNIEPQEQGPIQLEPLMEKEAFHAMVRKTKEYIRSGEIIQAVISQPFICKTVPDLWTLYRAQRFVNPSPYLFFMHLKDMVLVGSSPEVMVRVENKTACLRPIAGTRPRGKSEQEDRKLAHELLQDEKERAEHLMLVDLGRNDLGRIAQTGTVQVTDLMVVERYSHVMHLVSNISCDLKSGLDAWDVFQAAFPAGTLSGAPKIRAMQIISELEKEPRGPYGGAVGYISFHGNMDMAITIRTAFIENDLLTVRAGAGIVADSDPEKERQESVNKAKAIWKALQLIGHGAGVKL